MKLYICEKPSQARDLARNLKIMSLKGQSDKGFIGNGKESVTWAFGHLVQQLEPNEIDPKYKKWALDDLPIVPKKWVMKPNSKTNKQLNVVGGLLKKSNHVVISTDGDREGEIIGRELLDYFNWTGTIERLWLTSLDDNSIQKALKNIKPGVETEFLYSAGLARARADWLVGMNATRALSIKAQQQGHQGVLSVGRVQTPTLAIVVNRDLEIESFKANDYYDVEGVFSGVHAKWRPKNHYVEDYTFEGRGIFDSEFRCIDKEFASDNIAKCCASYSKAQVVKFETQRKKVAPPLLYSLSKLQQAANKKFGFGAKQVLDLAQSLYEKHKATSYPRSDCQYLPVSQLSEVKGVMSAIQSIDSSMKGLISNADLTIKSKVWNDKKLGAHHGIIPTGNDKVDVSRMSTDECKLYDLICRSYIAQFYPNYEYNKTELEINAKHDEKEETSVEFFGAAINVDVDLGWKVVINSQAELKQGDIPKLEQGQILTNDSVDVRAKQTKPPARYTEGTLIMAMESAHLFVTDPELKKVLKGNEGIGTEATRASMIDLLKKRGFLKVNKKQIISSEVGRALISVVPDAVKDPGMTAIMESSLSKIAAGEITLDAFMTWQEDWLEQLINSIRSETINITGEEIKTVKCPDCNQDMFLKPGKKGKKFWGCSGYPECSSTAQNENGRALFESDMPNCPECNKKLRKIKGKKGNFWSCKGYFDTPKCTFSAKDNNGKPLIVD